MLSPIISESPHQVSYQGKWSRILHWCHGQNINACKTTIPQIAEFLLYLHLELKLSVSALEDMDLSLTTCFLWFVWIYN